MLKEYVCDAVLPMCLNLAFIRPYFVFLC